MQTFSHAKTQIVPPHALLAAGLLLVAGCRAGVGLPCLKAAWRLSGYSPAKGEKAPDAWGASGADSVREIAAELASHWERMSEPGARTAQVSAARASLLGTKFLWHEAGQPLRRTLRAGKSPMRNRCERDEEGEASGYLERGGEKAVFTLDPILGGAA